MLQLTAVEQLRRPVVIEPVGALLERLALLGTQPAQFCDELVEPTAEVSRYIKDVPPKGYLSIIVQVPDSGKCK